MRRYFKVETINYDAPTEHREVSYDTARTARDVLRKRGVPLHKEERAKAEKKYYSESGKWIVYRRASSLPEDAQS